jgi:hypothetical protein
MESEGMIAYYAPSAKEFAHATLFSHSQRYQFFGLVATFTDFRHAGPAHTGFC